MPLILSIIHIRQIIQILAEKTLTVKFEYFSTIRYVHKYMYIAVYMEQGEHLF